MTQSSAPQADPVAVREYLYALALILGILGAIAVLAFTAATGACACTKAPDLVVVNRSATPVTIEWHLGNGLFGTSLLRMSGKIEAPACRASAWELPSGAIETTTRASGHTHDATVSVSVDHSIPGGSIQISADGEITDATPQAPSGDANICP
jgi:hypothetical protein